MLTIDQAYAELYGLLSDKLDHELFAELRQERFGGKALEGCYLPTWYGIPARAVQGCRNRGDGL